MRRLNLNQWQRIIRNTNELGEDVEILWLDDTDEYVLCVDTKIFEDGFTDEREAEHRLEQVLRDLNMQLEEKIEDVYHYIEALENVECEGFENMVIFSDFDEIVGFYLKNYGYEAIDIWNLDYKRHYYMSQWLQDRVSRALNIIINVRCELELRK